VLVTDDEVIEQGQVEHVGRGAQSQREPRIGRAALSSRPLGQSRPTFARTVFQTRAAGTVLIWICRYDCASASFSDPRSSATTCRMSVSDLSLRL
jgi:hypothetical protein